MSRALVSAALALTLVSCSANNPASHRPSADAQTCSAADAGTNPDPRAIAAHADLTSDIGHLAQAIGTDSNRTKLYYDVKALLKLCADAGY